MTLFPDTSVWSLLFRRDVPSSIPHARTLLDALENELPLATTGLVLQELLQGFLGPRARDQILDRFAALPFLTPATEDHIEAAALRNVCRRAGVQLATVDALIAQLCIQRDLTLLTIDNDFRFAAKHSPLRVWGET